MRELLDFLSEYEIFLYVLIGLISIIYIRRLLTSWRELKLAIFGLEKEMAIQRIRTNASILVALMGLMGIIFIITSFVSPLVPKVDFVPTPTMEAATPEPIALSLGADADASPTIAVEGSQNCVRGEIELTEPATGSEISGVISLKGIIQVSDFGFYKYEYSMPGDNSWMIIAASDSIDPEGTLGLWDTTLLTPGDYLLRLVVTDNRSNVIGVCVVGVTVTEGD